MPKKWLQRYLPDRERLSEIRALEPVRDHLNQPDLWHLSRRSVSGAFFVGLFCAFLPIPLQMLVAALLAIGTRVNLPISIALVWITNPLTMPPMFYFAYRLGAWLLGVNEAVPGIELSWAWISTQFRVIAYPLLVGSLVCGWVAGLTGFAVARVLWRSHVRQRWLARRERRRAAAAAKQQTQRAP